LPDYPKTGEGRTNAGGVPPAAGGIRGRAGMTLIELLIVFLILGILVTIALPKLQQTTDRARVARAIGDIKAIQTDIDGFFAGRDSLPSSLAGVGRDALVDPWGRPYQYFKFPPSSGPPAGARRDRFLVPINSTYDLFSLGKDGASSPSLQGGASRDDIVRGNDGGFIGPATNF